MYFLSEFQLDQVTLLSPSQQEICKTKMITVNQPDVRYEICMESRNLIYTLSHCTNVRQEHNAVALSTFTKYNLPTLVERCVTILGNEHIQVESSSLASGAMYLFLKS